MKTQDYLTPKCVEFNLESEGVMCYSSDNEGYSGNDDTDDWFKI